MGRYTIYGINRESNECYGTYEADRPENALLAFINTSTPCRLIDGVFVFDDPEEEANYLSDWSQSNKLSLSDWNIVAEPE